MIVNFTVLLWESKMNLGLNKEMKVLDTKWRAVILCMYWDGHYEQFVSYE